jgi:membrane-bound ClpP family serine protease
VGETGMILVITLALIGLLLVFLEFFLPSGILGVAAAGVLIGSIVSFAFLGSGTGWIIFYMILLLLLVALTCWAGLSRVRNKVSLQADQKGFQASSFEAAYIGKTGVVFTDLRPSGHILIEGKQLQAWSETGYLDKDCPVVVICGRGAYLIVKKVIKKED